MATRRSSWVNDQFHPPILTEDQEQCRLVVYLQKKNILHFAIWNQGKKTLSQGVKAKRMGMVAGVPDLMIPMPMVSKGLSGLFVELKRTNKSYVSEAQRYWLQALTKQGYRAVIAKGAEEAIAIIEDYFK